MVAVSGTFLFLGATPVVYLSQPEGFLYPTSQVRPLPSLFRRIATVHG